jgi:hypothetical protein
MALATLSSECVGGGYVFLSYWSDTKLQQGCQVAAVTATFLKCGSF